jgi:hypothetical protein
MKRLLMIFALLGGCLFYSIPTTQADPYAAHGYGWLQAHALNKFQRIHLHGPLYNYGPYDIYGGGYQFQVLTHHQMYNYIPNANLYQSLGGYGGYPGVIESAPGISADPGCTNCGGSMAYPSAPARAPRTFFHR